MGPFAFSELVWSATVWPLFL